jgi:quinol monooxygenase YgiN
MIIRIVKLKFQKDKVADFLNLFDNVVTKVNTYPGCQQMHMVRDLNDETLFFTYSVWENTTALENYRNSPLFQTIWPQIKSWFSEKAEAWSTEKV